MKNKNFYKALTAAAAKYDFASVCMEMICTNGKKYSGSTGTAYVEGMNPLRYANIQRSASTSQLSSAEGAGIIIGSGTTPPTVDDYALENQITEGFGSVTSFPLLAEQVYKSGGIVSCCSITNTSDTDDITINEIGYIRGCGGSWTILYDRIVLDEPITIAPNETRTIEYRLNISIPKEAE